MFTDSISTVLTKTHDFLSHVPLELEFIEGLSSIPRNLKMNVNIKVKWENSGLCSLTIERKDF